MKSASSYADKGGNIAYTEKYLVHRYEQEAALFLPQNIVKKHTKALSKEYTLTSTFYKINNYLRQGSINKISSSKGHVVYTFRSLDTEGSFCQLFTHSNGKEYCVFRRDLYGYSILDIATMEDFHYIPALSFDGGGETFIWIGFDYSPLCDILAVSGCFWAAPYDVCLVEIPDPMKPFTRACTLHDVLDPNYEIYCDINFDCWEQDTLIINAENDMILRKERLIFTPDEYLGWLR